MMSSSKSISDSFFFSTFLPILMFKVNKQHSSSIQEFVSVDISNSFLFLADDNQIQGYGFFFILFNNFNLITRQKGERERERTPAFLFFFKIIFHFIYNFIHIEYFFLLLCLSTKDIILLFSIILFDNLLFIAWKY